MMTNRAIAASDSANTTESERASRANAKLAIERAKTVRRHDKSVSSCGIPSSMGCIFDAH